MASAALLTRRRGVALQIGRTRSSPTQSSSECGSPAGRESGEGLDGAKLRNAKNLKDAVLATPFPHSRRSQAGPAPPRLTQIHPRLGPEREGRETSTTPPTTREEQGFAPGPLRIAGPRPRGSSGRPVLVAREGWVHFFSQCVHTLVEVVGWSGEGRGVM